MTETILLTAFVEGERADFVLKASKRIASYRMNVHTTKDCGTSTISGAAMISYKGSSETPMSTTADAIDQQDIDQLGANRLDVTTNPADKCGGRENMCVMDIQSIHKMPRTLINPKMDVTMYLPINYKMQATELLGAYLGVCVYVYALGVYMFCLFK